jgi:3-hydroxyisobutyrate dehydrogenase-like beta-hydroxyacid dehydrogenase
MTATIAFMGMGEAGSAIIGGWGESRAGAIRAYDTKSDSPVTAGTMQARYRDLGITGCASPAAAVAGAGIVFCTVTADQAVVAAEAAAPHLAPGAFWCDLNSCAPSSKRRAAAVIEAAGGRYVDVAVMAAVHPKRNMTPLLISGPHAEAIAPVLTDLPMAPRVVAGEIGAASSIKMIRSVLVKGLEALTAECVLAAVAAGVEDEVLGSLLRSHPGIDWPGQAAYNFERSIVHGERRAAEMEEVARTLSDLGLPDDMARATVAWQRRIAAAGVPAVGNARAAGPKALADLLLPAIVKQQQRGAR